MNRGRPFCALRFGVLTGLIAACAVAGIISVREWMLNPGGIYHDAPGYRYCIRVP